MGIKFYDILALARNGYTPADIKELLALKVDEPEAKPHSEEHSDDVPPADEKPEGEKEPKTEAEEEPDYKALYEESQKNLKEAQKNLEEAQKANIKQSINKETPDDNKTVYDIVRSFM